MKKITYIWKFTKKLKYCIRKYSLNVKESKVEKRNKRHETHEKQNKMADINPTISIKTLNINELIQSQVRLGKNI